MVVVDIIFGTIFLAYIILIIWLIFGIQKSKNLQSKESFFDGISIVVALKNEALNVEKLVQMLTNQAYPKDKFEIILVDDHSGDTTWQGLQKHASARIHILKNVGKGKKMAIETGIQSAKFSWIAVTDADCLIPETWINSMVNMITPGIKMVLGPVFIASPSGFLEYFQAIEFLGLQGATAGSAGNNHPVSANAANMLVERSSFEEVQPFKDNYHLPTGDDQFLLMAVSESHPDSIVYAFHREAVIYTYPVKNWKHYFSQRIRWASKGSTYTQLAPKMVGFLVFLTSVTFSFQLLFFVTYPINVWIVVLWFGKIAVDLLLIKRMQKLANTPISLFFYGISSIFYPLVVWGSVAAGWKWEKRH